MLDKYQLAVIGGGPAGLAAALEAEKNGIKNIIIIERDFYLGGILQQCIHNGFGLEYFKEELTGPEYAQRFISQLSNSMIEVKTSTMVVKLNKEKEIIAFNKKEGLIKIKANAIVLAMGCRERTREAIKIPGERAAGILTAGTAQRYINIEGYIPGKNIVILGSGDIGLIMARRLTLEGASVISVLEIMPYSTGLIRNKVQCLDDYDIPLKLNHTITRIEGKKRVKKVITIKVDKNFNPIKGTEKEIRCDTVLLSVGLIPENELSKNIGVKINPITGGPIINEQRETNIEGIFACGNVLQVHDLVDYATEEGEIVGKAVSKYLGKNRRQRKTVINLISGKNVNYVIPDKIKFFDKDKKRIKLFMRVKKPIEDVNINIIANDNNILSYKKEIVTPGEMVIVNLPLKIIANNIQEITISIKKRR